MGGAIEVAAGAIEIFAVEGDRGAGKVLDDPQEAFFIRENDAILLFAKVADEPIDGPAVGQVFDDGYEGIEFGHFGKRVVAVLVAFEDIAASVRRG